MKLLVDEFTTKITRSTRSFVVLVYPSGLDLSSSHLRY
ncbi:IS5/IS1182 family transposase, partial [Streptomyces sp. PT12]